jgi:two-component system LytT family response regulator
VTIKRLASALPPATAREAITYDDRLFLRFGEERAFVRVRDILVIEAEGDASSLRFAPHLTRKSSSKSLREWETRLPDKYFVRIHRSTIVNLDYVERLEPWSHASYHVYLRGLPEPLTMSRRFGAKLKDRFG